MSYADEARVAPDLVNLLPPADGMESVGLYARTSAQPPLTGRRAFHDRNIVIVETDEDGTLVGQGPR